MSTCPSVVMRMTVLLARSILEKIGHINIYQIMLILELPGGTLYLIIFQELKTLLTLIRVYYVGAINES